MKITNWLGWACGVSGWCECSRRMGLLKDMKEPGKAKGETFFCQLNPQGMLIWFPNNTWIIFPQAPNAHSLSTIAVYPSQSIINRSWDINISTSQYCEACFHHGQDFANQAICILCMIQTLSPKSDVGDLPAVNFETTLLESVLDLFKLLKLHLLYQHSISMLWRDPSGFVYKVLNMFW